MILRELFEAPGKTAVAAFGRMNPPTIGHAKLVDKIKSVDGDHYLFLSQTQKPKDNPLDFSTKLSFAKKFFPGVNVGHEKVRTPIQMLQMLEQLGYTDIVYVAGSDRVAQFEKLFNDYNGKEYNFNSIQVVSAGERDPDADGAEGMSASKMRAAAAAGDLEEFSQGVPDKKLAQTMYDAVRTGMGIKDKETTIDESKMSFQDMSKNREFAYTFRQYVKGNANKDQVAELVRGRVDSEQFADEVFKQGVKMGGAKGARIKELADHIRKDSNVFDLPGKAFKKIKKFAGIGEDVSPEDEDKFHNELDDLVHKYFGDSPDEEKMKKKYRKTVEKAPPGREDQVKALKKEFPDDEGAPYAIAWAQHNKKKKKKSVGEASNFVGGISTRILKAYLKKLLQQELNPYEETMIDKIRKELKSRGEVATESDVVLNKTSLREYIKDLIIDKLNATDDIDQLAEWLQMIVNKTVKSSGGSKFTVTSEDVILALEGCEHGMYYCSDAGKMKCRKGPKQSRG